MTEKWRKPGLSDEENARLDAWEEEQETLAYKHGVDIGKAMASYEVSEEAIRAYEAGEIDLWIDLVRAKSPEDWDAFEAEHGTIEELHARWAEKPLDNDTKDA